MVGLIRVRMRCHRLFGWTAASATLCTRGLRLPNGSRPCSGRSVCAEVVRNSRSTSCQWSRSEPVPKTSRHRRRKISCAVICCARRTLALGWRSLLRLRRCTRLLSGDGIDRLSATEFRGSSDLLDQQTIRQSSAASWPLIVLTGPRTQCNGGSAHQAEERLMNSY